MGKFHVYALTFLVAVVMIQIDVKYIILRLIIKGSIKGSLELIIPRLIKKMMDMQNLTEQEALKELYVSELYRQLESEEAKLWHLSVPTLFELWLEEKETGSIIYPEEA